MNKKSFLTLLILLFITLLIAYPTLCLKAAQDGLLLWFHKVLPSLLPFIIFINLLIPLDGLKGLITRADPLTRRFWHLPGYSFFAFLMGLIASYPMGAKTVKNLLEDGRLSVQDATITLCFSNNCGPLFIVATVGSAMLGHASLGYFLLAVHVLSALILSLFVTRRHHSHSPSLQSSISSTTPSFTTILNSGVMNAMDTIMCIGGYIILFSVLIALLTQTPLLPLLSKPFLSSPVLKLYFNGITAGMLELSNGTYALSRIQPSSIYSIAFISSCISFGGLCVYFQTLYVLEDKLSSFPYLICKFAQALISFALTLFLFPFYLVYTQKTSFTFHWTWWALGFLLLLASDFITQSILSRTLVHKTKTFSAPVCK